MGVSQKSIFLYQKILLIFPLHLQIRFLKRGNTFLHDCQRDHIIYQVENKSETIFCLFIETQ